MSSIQIIPSLGYSPPVACTLARLAAATGVCMRPFGTPASPFWAQLRLRLPAGWWWGGGTICQAASPGARRLCKETPAHHHETVDSPRRSAGLPHQPISPQLTQPSPFSSLSWRVGDDFQQEKIGIKSRYSLLPVTSRWRYVHPAQLGEVAGR